MLLGIGHVHNHLACVFSIEHFKECLGGILQAMSEGLMELQQETTKSLISDIKKEIMLPESFPPESIQPFV